MIDLLLRPPRRRRAAPRRPLARPAPRIGWMETQPGHQTVTSSLYERLLLDDAEAWRRLIHIYTPLMVSWCRRASVPASDIEDVLQEVLSGVAGAIAGFDRTREGATFRGWLRVICRNQIARYFRARRGSEPAAALDQLAADDARFDEAEVQLIYRRVLDLLAEEFEPRPLQVFRALTVEDREPAELAAELGMSVGAVYQAKYRVRLRFEQLLEELL